MYNFGPSALKFFLPNNNLCILQKSHVRFLSSSSMLCLKKKFNVTNSFTFQNEFQQQFTDDPFSKCRIVSSDLLSNQDEVIRNQDEVMKQKNESFLKQRRKNPSLRYKGEILFGTHPVYLALLQKKRKFHHLYIGNLDSSDERCNNIRKAEIIELSKSLNIPISFVDNKGLKILTSDAVHQGVCLDAGFLPIPTWDDQAEYQESQKQPLWLVLNELLDPMNVGAIIRSAYYFGVNKLFMVKGNSCKLSPTVSKASSGSLEVIDICQIENLEAFIKNRKNNGWCIVSTSAYLENKPESNKLTISATEFNIRRPTVLILGNEGRGIAPTIQNLCDTLVSIEPGRNLQQGIDSLNVSVAAGVLLYALNGMKNIK